MPIEKQTVAPQEQPKKAVEIDLDSLYVNNNYSQNPSGGVGLQNGQNNDILSLFNMNFQVYCQIHRLRS